MKTYFEISEENPNDVLKVDYMFDQPREGDGYFPVIKAFAAHLRQVVRDDRDHESVYYHGLFDLNTGEHNFDPDNQEPIEIDGVSHPLDENGEVVLPRLAGLAAASSEAILHSNTQILARLDVLTNAMAVERVAVKGV
jgi:hypothetical protein